MNLVDFTLTDEWEFESGLNQNETFFTKKINELKKTHDVKFLYLGTDFVSGGGICYVIAYKKRP